MRAFDFNKTFLGILLYQDDIIDFLPVGKEVWFDVSESFFASL